MATALYCRVSTEEQRERETIETQRDFAYQYFALHRLAPILEFADDGVSGAIPLEKRPAGQRLLAAATAGLLDAVYIYNLKRLGRNTRIILNGIADLQARQVGVVSMTEPFDMRDASGRFLVTVLSGVAELDRDTIAEQMALGIRRAAREGRWVGGVVPYGYKVIDGNPGRHLEPDEECLPGCSLSPAAVIRLLYERVGRWGWSARRACGELAQYQVPPRYAPGSRLNRLRQPIKGIWYAGDLSRLLRYPTYKGILVYGRGSKKGEVERPCPALVPEELWQAAQASITAWRRRDYPSARNYLLSGLLRCGLCGYALSGITTTDHKGDPYQIYRCSGRHQRAEGCAARVLSMSETDARAWRLVLRLLDDPAQALAAAALATTERDSRPDERANATLKLADLARQRDRIVGAYRRGKLGEEEFDRNITEIEREERELRAVVETAPVLATAPDWRSDAECLLAQARELLPAGAGPEARREVVRLLVRRIEAVREERFEVEWVFQRPIP